MGIGVLSYWRWKGVVNVCLGEKEKLMVIGKRIYFVD